MAWNIFGRQADGLAELNQLFLNFAAWEDRWQELSLAARRQYLDGVRTPSAYTSARVENPCHRFDATLLKELDQGGFIDIDKAGKAFVVPTNANAFLTHLQHISTCGMLRKKNPYGVSHFVQGLGAWYPINDLVRQVMKKAAGLGPYQIQGDVIHEFTQEGSWPDWALSFLKDPFTKKVFEAVESANKPITFVGLMDALAGHDATDVRETVAQLLSHLVIGQDLDDKTLDIVLGIPVEVVTKRKRMSHTVVTLEPVVSSQIGPDTGIEVSDLRAFLLELTVEPPRLKQSGELYQKEVDRIIPALEAFPDWMWESTIEDAYGHRVYKAKRWCQVLNLARSAHTREDTHVLQITPEGQRWLALDRELQYVPLFDYLRSKVSEYGYYSANDERFLGSDILAMPTTKKGQNSYQLLRSLRAEDKQFLRESIYRLMVELPRFEFFSLDSFLIWAGQGSRNPLLLGRQPRDVTVIQNQRFVPPLPEQLSNMAWTLLHHLIFKRWAPLGCVQLGLDETNHRQFARLPRLDVYFGKAKPEPVPRSHATSVVVQPDFTVLVIGMDATPSSQLAPFCDRERSRSSTGSMTFRLTRESILRGMVGGLSLDDIVARLAKLASKALPDNVVTQIRSWGGQVRQVTLTDAHLFRCPDAASAQRVRSLLGKSAEVIGESIVVWPTDQNLTPTMRKKLQDQGIFVQDETTKHKRK